MKFGADVNVPNGMNGNNRGEIFHLSNILLHWNPL